MKSIDDELNRLNFEEWLLIILIAVTICNIIGNNLQKLYVKTDNKKYLKNASLIFIITLFVTIIVYLYFVNRNYKVYKNSNKRNKTLYKIKLIGSILIDVGVILLLYFQINDPEFIGAPIT